MIQTRLKGLRFYLAGPIDRCPNGGKLWRDELTPWLIAKGAVVIDPLNKPCNIGLENDDARERRRHLKKEGRFDEFADIMKKVRVYDLRFVDVADALIVHVDMDIFMCGTFEELFIANLQKKPILVHCKQGVKELPDWLFGVLPVKYMFNSWDELKDYLRYIDSAEYVEDLGRWRFLNLEGLCPTLSQS